MELRDHHPDLIARRVVMACYLYYNRSVSMFTDHEFDQMCGYVANNWDRLEPVRQWQLGSPDAIMASGFHVKITPLSESAALNLALGQPMSGARITEWKIHPEYGRWAGITG